MPLYDYKCVKCQTLFESLQKIADRQTAVCPRCGYIGTLQMSTFADHTFKPFWHEDFTDTPVLVQSKSHYKDLCKKHGVYAPHVFGQGWNISEI